MNKDNKPRPAALDPVAALNALDLAVGSQEAEAELVRAVREFLPLIEGAKAACERFEELTPHEMATRAERIGMLAALAEHILETLPFEPTAEVGMPVDKRRHEVTDTVEGTPDQRGRITRVVEQGWEYDGLRIRRARVEASR